MTSQPEGTVPGAETAAPSLDELAQALADQKIRATLSDWEGQLADTMKRAEEAFTSQQAGLQAQIANLTGQLAAVRQQAGPPSVLLLARSLAQRVQSIAAANPDLGGLHFAGVKDQAARLADATEAAVNGKGSVADAEQLAKAVDSWFTRVHPRASGKFLEGMHSALDEAERIGEGLAELAPVAAKAAAVAAAV